MTPTVLKIQYPGTVSIPSGQHQVLFVVRKGNGEAVALLPGAKGNLGAEVFVVNGLPSLRPGLILKVGAQVAGDKIQTVDKDGKPAAVDAVEITEPLKVHTFKAVKPGLWALEQGE